MMQSIHGPIPREMFLEWLNAGDGAPLQISRGKNQDNFTTIISLPKTEKINYLFCDTNYSIPGIHQNDDFSFCGLYLRQDHSLHLADHRLGCVVDGLTGTEGMDSDDLRRHFCEQVNRRAEELIADDRRNLTVTSLSSEETKRRLDYYRQYGAKEEAIRAYFDEAAPDFRLHCDYPPIITAEMFGCRVPNAAGRLNLPQIKDIRILARCGVCGEPVRRERENTWRCPHCMVSAVPTTDQRLIDAVAELLRELCGHPDMVGIPASPNDDNSGVLAAEKELAQALEAAEFDEPAARAKALSMAAARFDAIGPEDYETMRIQHILTGTEPSAELDTVLLRQITSAILISPAGEVRLKLKNKQIVERSAFL